ncbi:MAG: hypothetical protein AAF765_14360 [Bacteroidota bacterium]
MKRRNLNVLALNKKVVSNFKTRRILGGVSGGILGCNTRDTGCNTTITLTGGQPFKECD